MDPPEKLPVQPRQRRFALKASYFDAATDDAYVNASDIKYADRHDHLIENNAAYRTFHFISVIFGAHDERTPQRYRGGLKKIVTQ